MKTLTIGRANFNGVAYSEDGRFLVTLNSQHVIRFWDLVNYSQRFVFVLPLSSYEGSSLSVHGNRLAGRNNLLDISETWLFVRGQTATPPPVAYRAIELEQKPPYAALVVTPSGERIAGNYRTEVLVWDARGKCLSQFHRAGAFWLLALAPNAESLAVGEVKGVWLLRATDGAEIARLQLTNSPQRMRFSPDGRLLAVAAGRSVWLWDVASYKPLARFPAFHRFAEGLAFSADSRLLAAGSRDGEVRLWDTSTCRQVGCLNWDVGAIHGLAFSPDGMTAAAAGHRGTIVLWDLE